MRACRPVTSFSKRACTDSEWVVITGTRTQVARDPQVRQAEDLAGLVADLQLLGGPAVLLERTGPRHHVQRQRRRERARASPTARRTSPGCGAEVGAGRPWRSARAACRCRADRRRRRPGRRRRSARVSPNSACSAPIATIIDSVVQFGLEMMPRGRSRAACGVHLGHDQRHVRVHPEGTGVVDRRPRPWRRRSAPTARRPRPARRTSRRPRRRRPPRSARRPRPPRRGRSACGRPSAPRRSAGSRPRRPGGWRGCSSITVPTAPVAPTTASVGLRPGVRATVIGRYRRRPRPRRSRCPDRRRCGRRGPPR